MDPVANPNSTLGIFSAFLSAVTWSVGVSAYSKLSQKYEPSPINFSRAFAVLPLFLACAMLGLGGGNTGLAAFSGVSWHNIGWLSISMVASYAFGDMLLLKSVSMIGLPSALAVASIYPIWAALYGYMFKNDPLSKGTVLGLLLVVSGTIVVILSKKSTGTQPTDVKRHILRGFLLALATSVCWSFNIIAVAEGGSQLSPFVTNTLRMILALLLCPAFGYVIMRTKKVFISLPDAKKMWWVFILEGFGGSLFFVYGMTNAPMSIASALSSLAPVITVPIAVLLGLERFSLLRTIGVMTVVFGIWLLIGFL